MIIWGSRTKGEPRGFVLRDCPRCHTERVHFVAEITKKFTLYFVPTFTTSRKAALICTECEFRQELVGDLGNQVIAAALPHGAMLAELERRNLGGPAGQGGRTNDASPGSVERLAVGFLVAGLKVAFADATFEPAEGAALTRSVSTIAAQSKSPLVVAAAVTAMGRFSELIDWIRSPATPPLHVMLTTAGNAARALPEPDRNRYFGQVAWLCHEVATAGRGPGAGVQDQEGALMDEVFVSLGLTTTDVATATAFCEQSSG